MTAKPQPQPSEDAGGPGSDLLRRDVVLAMIGLTPVCGPSDCEKGACGPSKDPTAFEFSQEICQRIKNLRPASPAPTGDSEAGKADERSRIVEQLRIWWSFDDRQQHTHSWHSREDFIEKQLPWLLDRYEKNVAALRAQPPQPTGDVGELVDELNKIAKQPWDMSVEGITAHILTAKNAADMLGILDAAMRSMDSRFSAHVQLQAVAQDALEAIRSLDEDALGFAHSHGDSWPIRDELASKLADALTGAGEK